MCQGLRKRQALWTLLAGGFNPCRQFAATLYCVTFIGEEYDKSHALRFTVDIRKSNRQPVSLE